MQEFCVAGSNVGSATGEQTFEIKQKNASKGARVALDIVTDESVKTFPSLFVPNVHGRGYTPGTFSLASPSFRRWRKEDRQKTIKCQQESVKVYKPAKELTLFAMISAVFEKTASNIGTLAFIWATVVLLGGYSVSLEEIDFWFVTVILVTEGARIFVRSHELEWQHQDSGTKTLSQAYHKGSEALHRSSRAIRAALSGLVTPGGGRRPPLHLSMDLRESQHYGFDVTPRIVEEHSRMCSTTCVSRLFRATRISNFLQSMQIISAVLSIVLSVIRLVNRTFLMPSEAVIGPNPTSALIVFYNLTVLEALIFLLERIYWHYQIFCKDILGNAIKRSQLPPNEESLYTVRRFFYDVYSACLTESVFEGRKMSILDYALSWLQSDTPSEQLAGVRALLSFSTNRTFCLEALKTIGTRQAAVEKLIEMITWKSTLSEQEIRVAAAKLLCNLVKFNRNSIRVAAIAGSLDGIFSLLSEDNLEMEKEAGSSHDSHQSVRRAKLQRESLPAHALGLRILMNLAKNPMNCSKIGETRGLLTRLFDLIDADNPALREYDVHTETPKDSILSLSLRLLGRLARAAGVPGKTLREEISKVVFSISSLRGVLNLKHEDLSDVLLLQHLVAEIISSLAMDENVSEVIGRTGGVIGRLFELFRCHTGNGDKQELKVAAAAGEALKMLVLKDEKNCHRIFRLEVVQLQDESRTDAVEELLKMLDDRERGHLAMGILTRFCKVTSNDWADVMTRIAARTLQVMEVVMEERASRQEAAIGLAAATVPLLSLQELERVFTLSQRVTKKGIVVRLRAVLDQNLYPSTRFPCLRRFCLELILALLNADSTSFLPEFHYHQFSYLLRQLAATTFDLENYSTFSNDIGVTFHTVLIEDLLDAAVAKFRLH